MKQIKIFATIIILLLLAGLIAITSYTAFHKGEKQFYDEGFYVGVTYCGNSTQEAKELIDKVKDYTNLFILQSGALMRNIEAMNEIGDYAIASKLNYAIYGSKANNYLTNDTIIKEFEDRIKENKSYSIDGPINLFMDSWLWFIEAKEKWGDQFIGIYYSDEPGGNMLDGRAALEQTTLTTNNSESTTLNSIEKTGEGTIIVYDIPSSGYSIVNSLHRTYYSDGRITVRKSYPIETIEQEFSSTPEEKQPIDGTTETYYKSHMDIVDYYPNGTITILETRNEYIIRRNRDGSFINNSSGYEQQSSSANSYTSGNNITKYTSPIQPYEQVLKQNPIQTHDDAAEAFVNMNKKLLEDINKTQLNEKSMLVFTADYGLYWWDYKSGYDMVLAELGWNNSITQEIGLVRGAATLQSKSWGTILTWKYTQPPYLTNGNEMFEQMKTSYEAGAQYIIVFNYSEDIANPNTLQKEHYQALEKFWKDVVKNPKVKHGNIKAEAALILPQNYGWGIRHPNDHIWGIWQPDDTSQQIWNQLQNKLDQHGLKLDIIFEDPNYPATGKYDNIYYWNQK
ncbi:MAG: hypothetical protein LBC12_07470 [Nitrososphaerota archaeon]|jgi:hypothetical protein|nr:hypothetical protein [Nitrososphaerota archaeon]